MPCDSRTNEKISCIQIVGSRNIQNLLLANYINEESGISCVLYKDLPFNKSLIKGKRETHLILYDYGNTVPARGTSILPAKRDQPDIFFALFNFPKVLGFDIEKKAYEEGIRGIFYEDIDLDLFKKGILAICSGELWFSRNALSQFAETRPLTADRKNGKDILTEREKDILILITFGLSNKKIAEKLFISQHTVKTHIYNVYQKINVANRMQASLWANQFLSETIKTGSGQAAINR